MEFFEFSEQIALLRENFSLERYIFGAGVAFVTIFFYRKYVEGGQFRKNHVKMDGKVVIITGANTGEHYEVLTQFYLSVTINSLKELERKQLWTWLGEMPRFIWLAEIKNVVKKLDRISLSKQGIRRFTIDISI